MMIQGCEIGKNAYLFYFSYSIEVDEALYNIVWYSPLMVSVYTIFLIHVCFDHADEVKLINIWACAYDNTMWSLCLLSYSSCELGCMAIV